MTALNHTNATWIVVKELLNLCGATMLKFVFLISMILVGSVAASKGVDCERIVEKCRAFMALEKGAFRCLQGAPPPIRISCVEHINEFKDCFRGCITKGGAETQCWATCFTPDALPKESNEDRSKAIGKVIERPRADKASAKASKTSNATKDHSPREQSVSRHREKLTRASLLLWRP